MALEPMTGFRVVDLFAGSGALGIEALSRGAEHVDFVEGAGAARKILEANLAELGIADRAFVWALELPRGLARLREPLAGADLILMDPPYREGLAQATLDRLAEAACLRSGARIVVEHHFKDSMPERVADLVRTRERRYGETVVSTYQNEAP